jgi:MFS family permease
LIQRRDVILYATCLVAGTAQGLLLPLLSYLLELRGVPSAWNGFQSSILYLGVLVATPFLAKPVKRWGYKPILMFGTLTVAISYILFPLWYGFWVWSILRFMVGVGEAALHFAAQLWIQSSAEAKHRGKLITLYGMFYGMGFGIGPLGLNLLPLGVGVPFGLFVLLMLVVAGFLWTLKNDYPVVEEKSGSALNQYKRTWKLAYLGLIPAVMYGFMEAGMVSTLPVVGNRTGLTPSIVSFCLAAFVVGSIVLQLPLGWWSDRLGRRPILFMVTFGGGLLFLFMPLALSHPYALIGMFALCGALVGSIFSLGMVYTTDILPKSLLAPASIISTLGFGIFSMLSPNVIGAGIQFVTPNALFYALGGVFTAYAMLLLWKGKGVQPQPSETG